jgi:hypothetical protein
MAEEGDSRQGGRRDPPAISIIVVLLSPSRARSPRDHARTLWPARRGHGVAHAPTRLIARRRSPNRVRAPPPDHHIDRSIDRSPTEDKDEIDRIDEEMDGKGDPFVGKEVMEEPKPSFPPGYGTEGGKKPGETAEGCGMYRASG